MVSYLKTRVLTRYSLVNLYRTPPPWKLKRSGKLTVLKTRIREGVSGKIHTLTVQTPLGLYSMVFEIWTSHFDLQGGAPDINLQGNRGTYIFEYSIGFHTFIFSCGNRLHTNTVVRSRGGDRYKKQGNTITKIRWKRKRTKRNARNDLITQNWLLEPLVLL